MMQFVLEINQFMSFKKFQIYLKKLNVLIWWIMSNENINFGWSKNRLENSKPWNYQICMLIPCEKWENEEFDDEEFLTRKTDEKKWGIDQSKMNDFCLNLALLKESLVWNLIIMTKLSHKNAIKLENMPKFLPVPIIWFLRSKNLSI